ncbi:MAG TPA: hypothetical protein VGZ00_11785 [Candidatus Baltobacteraceae bacterium]|jgi:hypothetical protein|nr:hypothetical protein [Candidatus Baltobacteraceae bacterium]
MPPSIEVGAFQAYFMFDVADTIDLSRLGAVGEGTARAPLQLRLEASPSFIEFLEAPVIARFPDLPGGIGVRAKIFDYGVVSIRLTIPFAGSWTKFAEFTRRLRSDPTIPQLARKTLDSLLSDIEPALDEAHSPLAEDYFIFEIESFSPPLHSARLLSDYAPALASLVMCEERSLMPTEQEEALRVNSSYFEEDLAVVQWDTAFVYDRRDAAGAVEDILEFANTQLLELRRHDTLLDAELEVIYKLEPKSGYRPFGRNESQKAADRIRYLIVDVFELTDRSSNVLKIIGDAYYARLYRGAAQRLGLKDWQRQIDLKLKSVGDMYRFFNDQAQTARSEFFEIIIILLIAFEIVIGIIALRR